MWFRIEDGRKLFLHGQENYNAAALAAEACSVFKEDVEDEWVTDEARSCYNCHLRRWTAESFQCQGHVE
jgi:hypothetical protein